MVNNCFVFVLKARCQVAVLSNLKFPTISVGVRLFPWLLQLCFSCYSNLKKVENVGM